MGRYRELFDSARSQLEAVEARAILDYRATLADRGDPDAERLVAAYQATLVDWRQAALERVVEALEAHANRTVH